MWKTHSTMASDRPTGTGSTSLGLQKTRRPSEMDDSLSTQSGLPLFIAKLWNIVENPKTDSLIRWNPKGDAFVVPDPPAFSRVLLPQYFKHRNMASFIRVLNMYGFRKKPRLDGNSLRNVSDEMEFVNPHFKRGFHEDLRNISRKVSGREPKAVRVHEIEVKHMLDELGELRRQHETADLRLSDLKSENDSLWNELQDLRRRHQTQQTVVHKLINFLAALVRPAGGRGIFLRATGPHAALTQDSNDSSASPSVTTALAPFQPGMAAASDGLLNLLSSLDAESTAAVRRVQTPNSVADGTNEEGPTVEDLFDNGGLDVQQQQAETPPYRGVQHEQQPLPSDDGTNLPLVSDIMVPKGHRRGRASYSGPSVSRTGAAGQRQVITQGVFRGGSARSGTPLPPASSEVPPVVPRINNSGGTMAEIAPDRTTSRLPAQAFSSLDLTPRHRSPTGQEPQPAGTSAINNRNAKILLRPQQTAPVSQAIMPVSSTQRAIVQYPVQMTALGASGRGAQQQQITRRAQDIVSPYGQPTFAGADMQANQPMLYQSQQPTLNGADNNNHCADNTAPQTASANGGKSMTEPDGASAASDLKGIHSQLNNMQDRLHSMRGSLSQQLSTSEDNELFNKLFGIDEFSDSDLQNAASSLVMGSGSGDDPYYGSPFGDMFGANGGEGALNMDERGNFVMENVVDHSGSYGGAGAPSVADGGTGADADDFDLNAVKEAFELMQNATPTSSLNSPASVDGHARNVGADTADEEFAQLLGADGEEEVLNSGRVIQHNSTAPAAPESGLKSPLKTPDVRLPIDMHGGNGSVQQRPTFPQRLPPASGYNRGTPSAVVGGAPKKVPSAPAQNSPRAAVSSVNGNGKRKLLQNKPSGETSVWSGPPAKKTR